MKKVINQPDNVKNKKSSHGFGHLSQVYVFFGYFILVFILTYALSDNILDISVTLKNFVGFMAFYFSGIAKFGKYAAFPQVAQLFYSICIVTLPVAIVLSYKASKNDLYNISGAMEKRLPKIRAVILFSAISIFCLILVIIYWLPGGPVRTYHDILGKEYDEKYAFSIVISLVFVVFILMVGELLVTIKLKREA